MPTSHKILIAEDDSFLKQIIGQCFKEEGFEVTEASDGQKTLDLIRENAFDLVILDLQMPILLGTEVLQRLKEEKNKTPVMVYTNFPKEFRKEDVIALGAVDFFEKSNVTLEELKRVVHEFLGK